MRIKRLLPADVLISFYTAYVLPHLEYCCPLFLSISKTLKINMKCTNRYAIKTSLNLGNSAAYDVCLAVAAMDTLEQRRILQLLIPFFKYFKLDGPNFCLNISTKLKFYGRLDCKRRSRLHVFRVRLGFFN